MYLPWPSRIEHLASPTRHQDARWSREPGESGRQVLRGWLDGGQKKGPRRGLSRYSGGRTRRRAERGAERRRSSTDDPRIMMASRACSCSGARDVMPAGPLGEVRHDESDDKHYQDDAAYCKVTVAGCLLGLGLPRTRFLLLFRLFAK